MNSWRKGESIRLSARIALAASGAVLVVALALTHLLLRHEQDKLFTRQDAELARDAHQAGNALRGEFREFSADAVLMAHMPPIQGIVHASLNHGVDPRDGSSLAHWRGRLEQIFAAFVESHPYYLQVRFIGMAGKGRELVRVHQHDGRIEVVEPARLQAKADRDYFRAAAQLQAGDIYVSDINLNREHGRVETPHQPTLRVAMPVFAPDGRIFGMVVLNIDFHYLEQRLGEALSPDSRGYLANMAGDYLWHPDARHAFGFDLGRRHRWQDDFPELETQALARAPGLVPRIQRIASPHGPLRVVAAKVGFDPRRPERYLTLIHTLPESVLESQLQATRATIALSIAASAVLVLTILLWLIRQAFVPLKQLAQAADEIAGGHYDTPLPEIGMGELGTLGHAFTAMRASIGENHANLEAIVRERTADLQKSEARTRAIVATMLDSVVHIDARGTILTMNDAAQAMFGYTAEEMVGRNVAMLMPEPHASAHDGYLATYLQTRRPRIIGSRREVSGRRKDGSHFPLELAVNEMVDDAGSSFIGVLQDLTEKKAGEQALKDALEAARAATEAKGTFLANMSHEIRTPLNAVLGLAQIGMRDNRGRETGLTYGRILDAGQHLLGVINDILDFSKIEAGKLQIEQHPFALHALVDNARSFIVSRAEAKGLPLTISLDPDLPAWVEGDTLRLTQILTNLLSNAVKFTNQGEVRLRVAREGDMICFQVSDSGIGMSAEQVARLFQPFEQADSSTSRRYGGTGLGLVISQHLANLMGGEITVQSQPGAGSCFTLCLPLPAATAPASPGQSADTQGMAGPRLTGVSILAAEDVEVNRLILQDMLEHEGARLAFAHDGQQVLERIEKEGEQAFDVVLMDIQMPVMDGLEASRRIAELAPGLPVIGLTAHALEEERQKCLAAGMRDHVTKPIDVNLLVAAIRRHARCDAPMATARPRPDPAGETPTPALPMPRINHEALLARFKGRRDFIARLATSALEHHAAEPDKLREAARIEDHDTLAFLAHGLKSLGANLMAGDLFSLAGETEMAAREARADTAELALRLALSLEDVLSELTNTYAAPSQDG